MFPVAHYIKGFFANLLNPKISNFAFVSSSNKLERDVVIYRKAKVKGSTIGRFSYVGNDSDVECADIGRFCSIADHCRIGMASHSLDKLSTSPIFTISQNGTQTKWIENDVGNDRTARLTIGNDVWIGSHALIKSGIEIGDGAIVAAGAVVVKDVPPYAVVGGVPAKVIRYRFDEKTIEFLEELKWWNFSDDVLKKNISLFQTNIINIDALKSLEKEK